MGRKLHPNTIRQRQTAQAAVRLRLGGATFQQIAEDLGYYDRSSAYNAVQNELKRAGKEDNEALINTQVARLDQMHMRWWTILFPPPGVQYDIETLRKATVQVLAIMKRRADLLGMDAAKRVDVRMLASVLVQTLDGLPLPVAQAAVMLMSEDTERTRQAVELLTGGQGG